MPHFVSLAQMVRKKFLGGHFESIMATFSKFCNISFNYSGSYNFMINFVSLAQTVGKTVLGGHFESKMVTLSK